MTIATSAGRCPADDNRSPSVGSPGRIENLLLPGSELRPRPLENELAPIVIRIENAFRHGDAGYRYDLVFFGMVPGEFDLKDFLVRSDGASTDDLPPIPVSIQSLLPPGQIQPNPLVDSGPLRVGGYRLWAWVALLVWLCGLVAILLVGRKKQRHAESNAKKTTLADLLRPRLEAAMKNQLPQRQYAELERMLTALWTRQLGLDQRPPDEAIRVVRSDPEVGPLMRQLEIWMHSPRREDTVDLSALLKPLANLPASAMDGVTTGEVR